jgi:hypothetical protein
MVEYPLHHGDIVAAGDRDERLFVDPGVIDLCIEPEQRNVAAVRLVTRQLVQGERGTEVTELVVDATSDKKFEDIFSVAFVVFVSLMTNDDLLPPDSGCRSNQCHDTNPFGSREPFWTTSRSWTIPFQPKLSHDFGKFVLYFPGKQVAAYGVPEKTGSIQRLVEKLID